MEIELGNIYYREKHDIVGEIILNAGNRKIIKAADIILSYINPETNEHEFTKPYHIRFETAAKEVIAKTRLDENVVAKTKTMKIISEMKKSIETKKIEKLKKELEELIEATVKLGEIGLTSKTMSIREKIEREGLTPDVSREIASLISKIITGKSIYITEKKGERVE